MKNIILATVLVFISITTFAQGIGASFSKANFYSPTDGHYIETYMNIQSKSVKWVSVGENQTQASVEITYLFKQESEIKKFSKEVVKSPIIKTGEEQGEFFLNIQRIPLKKGIYDLIIQIKDLNAPENKTKTTSTIIDVDITEDAIAISDILCLDRYEKSTSKSKLTKSGFDLIPYTFNFFPENRKEFKFYAEIYNTDKILGKDKPYLLSYYLINLENNSKIEQYHRFSRRTSKSIDPFLASLDISKLPSGKFSFAIEIRDENNQLMTIKTHNFNRQNSEEVVIDFVSAVNIESTFAERITDVDSLTFLIRSIAPIQDEREKAFAKNILTKPEIGTLQRYLYYFWSNKDSKQPEIAFLKYMKEVEIVDKEFGSAINEGFETDRGRVYLQYGPPNSRAVEKNDPAWLPYEIWHYYSTPYGNQRNIKFAFYSTDRSVDDFQLLHSTARGEIQNYRWRYVLRDMPSGGHSIDDTGADDAEWGTRLNDLWNNPR